MRVTCTGSTRLLRPCRRSITNTAHPPRLCPSAFLFPDELSNSNHPFSISAIDRQPILQTQASCLIRSSTAYTCQSTANCPSQSRSPQLTFGYMPLTPPQECARGQYRRKHDSKQKAVQRACNAKRRRPQPCLIPCTSGLITLPPQSSPEPVRHLRNTDRTAC